MLRYIYKYNYVWCYQHEFPRDLDLGFLEWGGFYVGFGLETVSQTWRHDDRLPVSSAAVGTQFKMTPAL